VYVLTCTVLGFGIDIPLPSLHKAKQLGSGLVDNDQKCPIIIERSQQDRSEWIASTPPQSLSTPMLGLFYFIADKKRLVYLLNVLFAFNLTLLNSAAILFFMNNSEVYRDD